MPVPGTELEEGIPPHTQYHSSHEYDKSILTLWQSTSSLQFLNAPQPLEYVALLYMTANAWNYTTLSISAYLLLELKTRATICHAAIMCSSYLEKQMEAIPFEESATTHSTGKHMPSTYECSYALNQTSTHS